MPATTTAISSSRASSRITSAITRRSSAEGKRMQKLLVYQSLWAMERRRPDGLEWTLDEKLSMIRDAGFDGAGVRFFDLDYAKQVTTFLRAHDMSWQAQCYPQTIDDLKP